MFKITSIVPNRIFGRPPSSIRCRSDPECKVIPYESRRQSQLVMKNPFQIAISCQSRQVKKMLRRAFSASPERSVSALAD